MESARAERLPIATWTNEQGLPHDRVRKILHDTRGFLWVGTVGGLARFDGERFVVYGREQGLANPFVHEIHEGRDGTLWAGTEGGGLCRFEPSGLRRGAGDPAARFTCAAPPGPPDSRTVRAVHEDRKGTIWVGTHAGLFRLGRWEPSPSFEAVALPGGGAGGAGDATDDRGILAIAEATDGTLWFGSTDGLFRRSAEGVFSFVPLASGPGGDVIRGLRIDAEGRLWAAHQSRGLFVAMPRAGPPPPGAADVFERPPPPDAPLGLDPPVEGAARPHPLVAPLPSRPGEARWLLPGIEIPTGRGRSVEISSDGAVWIAFSSKALARVDTRGVAWFDAAHGLSDESINALEEDAAGNLWIGSDLGGLQRILRRGWTGYGQEDGLGHTWVSSFAVDADGALLVVAGRLEINRFDRGSFTGVQAPLPAPLLARSIHHPAVRDRAGDWWFATPEGLYRFDATERLEDLARARPRAHYTTRDGLPGDAINTLYEDAGGDLWVGAAGVPSPEDPCLARWDRAAGRFVTLGAAEGLPPGSCPTAIGGTPRGDLWAGFTGGRAAWRRDGAFSLLTPADGLPAADVNGFYAQGVDLWIATEGEGLARLREGNGASGWEIARFNAASGLPSDYVRCLTADLRGRLYAGTAAGIARLDPGSERFTRRYGKGDGLPGAEVWACHARDDGELWFGFFVGVARWDPAADDPIGPPRALIAGLRVAGVPVPISELGEERIDLGHLAPDRDSLLIELMSRTAAPASGVLFQYRMEGAAGDWSAPSGQRSVNYARLAPGRYRFEARAVGPQGEVGPGSASIAFTLDPPLWRRGWFLLSAALLVAGGAFGWHRRRVARLVELERIRTRIATDLHDDVGSSLSQIAILSEVAASQAGAGVPQLREPLTTIAATSRELVDTMGDIVWAINPARDRLADLAYRIRRFASDSVVGRGLELTISLPEAPGALRLHSELRQQIFLVFKESLSNAIRHAGARGVSVELSHEPGRLTLRVADDGRGFDTALASEGHGLHSMAQRAARVGGRLEIVSRPGAGTAVTLTVPT